jgi:hypothetical protein
VKIVVPEANPHFHSPNGQQPIAAGGMQRT